jgi:hypothetical protein
MLVVLDDGERVATIISGKDQFEIAEAEDLI